MMPFSTDPALFSGYLSDESGIPGHAEGICFPKNIDELSDALLYAQTEGKPVTVQGSRTGYRGLAVPQGGYIINLSKMNRFLSFRFDADSQEASVTVQTGITLSALNQALQMKSSALTWEDDVSQAAWERYQAAPITLFFPPNPTEETASLGGILASGAVGSHVHAFGSTDSHVISLRRVSVDSADASDLSSIIAECTLKLSVKPRCTCALMLFTPDYASLSDFLRHLNDCTPNGYLISAEFFDRSCFHLTHRQTACIPSIPENACAGLSLEIAAPYEESLYLFLEDILAAMETVGLQATDTLVATAPKEIQNIRKIRHTLTEAANDLSFGKQKFIMESFLSPAQEEEYPSRLEKLSDLLKTSSLPGFLMGYAGNRNFHLRLLPANPEQESLAASILTSAE